MKREIVNGSPEPLWRMNARSDADKFKAELLRSPSRRKFLGGAGAALMLEYVAQRRAVALPLFKAGGPSSSVVGITNARTGATYQYLPAALVAMQSGDTILLPAGTTYQYLGTTYNYALWQNSSSIGYGATAGSGFNSMFLGYSGRSPNYAGILPNADYGTIQAVGSANNGRALITPPYGILASDYHNGDTEMFFVGSTPASNWGTNPNYRAIFVDPAANFGQFAYFSLGYTGVDTIGNGLTGVTGTPPATIPAGTLVAEYLGGTSQAPALFKTVGANPGWTFTNLELAYAMSDSTTVSPIFQGTSFPGDEIGSMTLNNCYIHNCTQGPGEGYAGGYGSTGTFAYLFDTELTQCGNASGQTHNMYIGSMGELMMDNCWSHDTSGTWLVKSRASLNILTYNQIRGERSDANTGNIENSGCDFSVGGLIYIIGDIHEMSLNAANAMINMNAEGGLGSSTVQAGSANPLQEIYAINSNLIGPSNGVGRAGAAVAPVALNVSWVQNPEMTVLSQSAAGSLPARGYWVALTNVGSGGETNSSPAQGNVGIANAPSFNSVREFLSVSANNVLGVASPVQHTGAISWNCYMNYADPPLFFNGSIPVSAQEGNFWFWDSGFTEPIFSTTSGGTTISVTGTFDGTTDVVTSVSGLSGLASLNQLQDMAVYVGGTATGLSVQSVDAGNAKLTLNGVYGTAGTVTITFGYFLYVGLTYVTSLGESTNSALVGPYNSINGQVFGPYYWYTSPPSWYDGSYTARSNLFILGATIQVPPGKLLVVNAPPSGPSYATGINIYATAVAYQNFLQFGVPVWDGQFTGMSRQNSSTVSFGGSWTSPAGVITKAQGQVASFSGYLPNLYLQNSSPLSIGTPFGEPPGGIVNHNARASKLQWYRRAGLNFNGSTMDIWYAVVPTGGLSSYTDTIYSRYQGNGFPATLNGSISVWRGCATNPFDANFPTPVVNPNLTGTGTMPSVSVSTAAGNVTVLAGYRCSSGTAGSGFTQISTAALMNAEYASFSSAQTGLNVTSTSGANEAIMAVDALVGTSAPPTLISTVTIAGSGASVNFTISSANAGDILYLFLGEDQVCNVCGMGKFGPPPLSLPTVGSSPIVVVQNCLSANFNPSTTSGSLVYPITGTAQSVTETTNLYGNPFNGSSFGAPLWSVIFADPVQSDYVYTLASGSPALGAATGPGTSPHGQNLVPQYQVSWNGSPTPGTPIPAKASRNDISNTPGATAGAIGALS